MNVLKLVDLRVAVAAVCAFCLATACGSNAGDGEKQEVRPNIPSVARDDRAVTSGVAMVRRDAGTGAIATETSVATPPPPTTYRELMQSGKRLARAGHRAEALAAFTQASAKSKRASSPRIEMARILVSDGKYRAARKQAALAVKLAPTSSYAWNTLGRVELGEGNREAAITSFQRATQENADNSYAWNNLGYTLLLDNEWDAAVTALEQATSGHRPTSYMWNNLGMAYEHEDRLDEARAAYRQAASAGSQRGLKSLDRLRGVTSIKVEAGSGDTDADGADTADSAGATDGASDAVGADTAAGGDEAEQGGHEDVLGC